ncbi:DeoR/GlpR family DNA-binding transcription regulator [Christensenellaceae bacterium OttesenSCG-928-L17]|nr:DeoR/GlpR family DNA-binding transcription regulator [Christensenellaceae bacterium OttesenSCG-928-L17]
MLARERFDIILKALIEKNTIKVSDVMKLCSVSHETARRDLESLQEHGYARRVHGGAVLIPHRIPDETVLLPARSRESNYRAEHLALAQAAAKVIQPGDSVYIDHGTTMTHLAQCMHNMQDLIVLTPSLHAIHALSESKNKTISLGGELLSNESLFVGTLTQTAFTKFYVDKAFISCAGLQIEKGYLTDYETHGLSRQLIREHATKLYLVVTSEKIGVNAFFDVFPLDGIDTIVVDQNIRQEDIELLQGKGIELIIVPFEQIAPKNEDLK